MKKPHIALALMEMPRLVMELGSLMFSAPWLRRLPKGDGHAVMIIPGFLGNDRLNHSLVRYLKHLGYNAAGWGMGRNLGPDHFAIDELKDRVTDLANTTNGTITLIGHSLGGLYAREIARMQPDNVRQVISLGTPFGKGSKKGSNAKGMFDRVNPGTKKNSLFNDGWNKFAEAPPVPTTSIYTKSDGVVNWRTNIQHANHPKVQNIEVLGSHSGLTLNPAVWYLLALRLQQPHDNWQPLKSKLFNQH
jgi:pimeloyl-ACP methyl ester carboxylesterase